MVYESPRITMYAKWIAGPKPLYRSIPIITANFCQLVVDYIVQIYDSTRNSTCLGVESLNQLNTP